MKKFNVTSLRQCEWNFHSNTNLQKIDSIEALVSFKILLTKNSGYKLCFVIAISHGWRMVPRLERISKLLWLNIIFFLSFGYALSLHYSQLYKMLYLGSIFLFFFFHFVDLVSLNICYVFIKYVLPYGWIFCYTWTEQKNRERKSVLLCGCMVILEKNSSCLRNENVGRKLCVLIKYLRFL